MSLIAICPACNTHFSVVPDQLKISEGWVRCGSCHEVFDAIVHSSSESSETFCMPLESTAASVRTPAPAAAASSPDEPIPTAPVPFRPRAQTADSHRHSSGAAPAEGKPAREGPPTTIDTDIDSTSPYMSVGEVLDSIPSSDLEDAERMGFVQRWLRGRQSQHAPLEATASTYPTIEAKESQQQELAHRKSLEQPEQRIQSVLDTLDAIRRQQPTPSEKPTYADPRALPAASPTTRPAATPAAVTPAATPHTPDVDALQEKLRRLESGVQVREPFPWSTATGSHPAPGTAPRATAFPPSAPSSAFDTAADSETSFPSSFAAWDELDTRPPASAPDSSLLPEPDSRQDAASSEFARSLQSRAMRVHGVQPPEVATRNRPENSSFDDKTDEDGVETTLPSELADGNDSTLEEKIGAVRVRPSAASASVSVSASDTATADTAAEKSGHSSSRKTTRKVEKEPAFVRAARRAAFWQSRPMRILGYTACLLAATALLLQYTHFHRNRLAVQFPAARSALQQMCDVTGCQLAAWRQIQSVNVESSDFTLAPGGQRYRMTLGLRNHSHLPVAAPWVELTLTDSQDRPVVRRPFSPYELGIKDVQFQPGKVYEGDVLIDINPDILDPRYISGYRVLAFYP